MFPTNIMKIHSSVLHALVILLSIGAAECFNAIHRYQDGLRPTLPPSSKTADCGALCAVPGPSEHDENYRRDDSSVIDLTRRRGGRLVFQSLLIGALPWDFSRQIAHAEDLPPKGSTFVSGTVNLPPGITDPGPVVASNNSEENNQPPPKPALYVTVRPNRPDNVPRAILDGSRGKPPPVLAARFEDPAFPFEFGLGEKDLTPEGLGNETDGYWWSSDDLIVSARWDSDGVAATRSPEDLVGRNLWKQGTTERFVLELQGRGSFGKFATKKS